MKKLTPKQLAFVTLVIKYPDKPHSVLYMQIYKTCKKPDAAKASASKLLTQPNVKAYITKNTQKVIKKLDENNEMSVERILLEYKRLCFVNAADLYDKTGKLIKIHKLPRDISAAIQEVRHHKDGSFSYKLFNKQAVLTDLGKASGLIKDVIELIITRKNQPEESNTAPVKNSLDFDDIKTKSRSNGAIDAEIIEMV